MDTFSSWSPGKLVLTESSLHASSIFGGSNIIRHCPCPKSRHCNRFGGNVGHHRKPTSKPPSSLNTTDIFEVREVLGCTLILPVILSFKFNLGFLILGFGDTETPYWSRDSSANLIGCCRKACTNQWSWIHGLGILTAQIRWWKLKRKNRGQKISIVWTAKKHAPNNLMFCGSFLERLNSEPDEMYNMQAGGEQKSLMYPTAIVYWLSNWKWFAVAGKKEIHAYVTCDLCPSLGGEKRV